MKTIKIQQKLEELDVSLDSVIMGDFDQIGDITAKRNRANDDPNYKKYGCFYRSNYERGILINYLIRKHNLTSFLEIGFGRGYATLCAAKAFYDAGVNAKITTIDPNLNEEYVNTLQQVFPKEWFKGITFMKGTSTDAFTKLNDKFDLVYIDGDHSYEGTRIDWEGTKDRFNKFCLFDDYHLPQKQDKGTIQCSRLIDEIDESVIGCLEKELIIMDRRMFFDDRQYTDDMIEYGQVLLTKQGTTRDDW